MRNRWLTAAALLLAAIASIATASAASATDPLQLESGYVTDQAGVLSSSEENAVESRLEQLTQNSSADLFVVFVDEFTSPSDRVAWADQVATDNNLGPEQYLLAIAVEQRAYYISAATGGPLSDSRLDGIEERIQPLLGQGDWDGAVLLAADEIQGDGGAGLMRGVLIVAGVVAVIVVAWLVMRLIARRRREAAIRARGAMPEHPDPNDPFSTLTDEQVETQAGSAIVRADDAITSSREELDFAIAQFGEEATAGFTEVITAAKAKMAEAFDLKQKLDDEVEDSVHDRRAWHIRIIGLCDEIDAMLDENTEAFDALRALQQNAPQELDRVRRQRAAVDAVVAPAADALAALSGEYDDQALATVIDNPAQARERVALADRSIDAAATAIAEGETGRAAFAIRTAEQAVAQAGQLATAITALGAQLAAAETQSRTLLVELQNDLATARQLPDPDGSITGTVSSVDAQVEQAETSLSGARRSPQRALDALTAANTQIDAAIAQARERAENARRQSQLLGQTISQATMEIGSTRQFIETRRGTIGPDARTRLAQAEVSLNQAIALQPTDESAALAEANRALRLIRQAGAQARSDVSMYQTSRAPYGDGGWDGGLFGGGSRSRADSGLAGDILGGIIGGLLSGGGGSSRSGGWRSSGGGGFRSSGFGGGGRSGRSGGGRF